MPKNRQIINSGQDSSADASLVVKKDVGRFTELLTAFSDYNPDKILQTIEKESARYLKSTDEKEKLEIMRGMFPIARKASITFGLTTVHLAAAEAVPEEYRTMFIEVVRNVEKENDCEATNEKILAEVIASSYVGMIQYSRELTRLTEQKPPVFKAQVEYLALLGKEVDRKHRTLINAISTLQQLKNPSMEVNVKAKNAFVSQNQQFNAFGKENKENEINNP